ncbi:DUF2752 domain-containing protein [Zavarzinella formosa]|uniref:DUF2752 domain-containing protein n=1 Tax=Zavarzinella formosa TaxID=360055 RepID=UPI0002EB5A1D|nr:DUF2752 domain-containing protein [Zavarzinella formosa]
MTAKGRLARRRRRHWEVLVLSLVALVAAPLLEVQPLGRVSARGLPEIVLPPTCASQAMFGVDCPGCGLTRSFVHLAHGSWRESLQCHRLGWLLMALAAVQVPYRLCALRWPRRQFVGEATGRWTGRIIIGLLLGNWVLGLVGRWMT